MTPQSNHHCNTWAIEDITTFYCRIDVFRYSYFSYTILEWNKLDMKIRNQILLFFKNYLLKIDQLTAKP